MLQVGQRFIVTTCKAVAEHKGSVSFNLDTILDIAMCSLRNRHVVFSTIRVFNFSQRTNLPFFY